MTQNANETTAPTTVHTLQQFPEKLAVINLPAGAEIPTWAESSSLFSITATALETSLVCAGRDVPTKVVALRGLTGFAVQGPLQDESVRILVDLLVPLSEARISVHVLSTFETVWLLVPVLEAERAGAAWRERGHVVNAAVPVKPARKKK
jgi:hypothetical protein